MGAQQPGGEWTATGGRPRRARRAEPSRLPRRGAAALLLTAGGLALLFSFRTPESDSGLLGVATDPGSADTGDLAVLPDASAMPEAASADPGEAASPQAPATVLGPPAPEPTPDRTPGVARTPRSDPTADPTPDPTPDSTPDPTPKDKARTATGDTMRTPYGDIAVKVTVKGSRITDVTALAMPDGDRHSRRIAQVVEPMLHDDVIALQDWRIHIVSGATYDSVGYARSVQSALDKLGV